ncbi:MAG TPA: polysaccharide deacetylase family protein [Pseudogracilibacillus sp.]|nr:polysaccharide deacetylase family protein [Pseudogracilibacillus sp.]
MLSEELGFHPDERLLIINADDFGMCNSTNRAIETLLKEEVITSTSLMTTCPWMKEAALIAKDNPRYDVGLHLTFTSEWENYKWAPITKFGKGVSFIDKFGYFPQDVQPVESAQASEIEKECIAQIETALSLGVDLTHLDNHMVSLGGITGGKNFMNIVIELSAYYGLPLRLPRTPFNIIPHDEALIKLVDDKGVVIPDYINVLPFVMPEEKSNQEAIKENVLDIIHHLMPGVTEVIYHPSIATDELKGITDTWSFRNMEFNVFRDPEVIKVIQEENIRLITWRDMRNLQRSKKQ